MRSHLQLTAPIGFLFKAGRRDRRESGRAVPGEFFYALDELLDRGLPVEFLEETEFAAPLLPAWLERPATRALNTCLGLNAATLARLGNPRALSRLNRFSALVATANSQGRALAFLAWTGLLKTPVLLLAMGAWPERGVWKRFLLSRLYSHISLAPIGLPEAEEMRKRLPAHQDLGYLRFGIDHRFWTPGDTANIEESYVLAVGNDPHRDWSCLADAWCPEFPLLKIVTRRPVSPSRGQISIVAGDWRKQILSDEEMRELYRKALFIVLPLRDTLQPAGQSVCLQAMACGKAVVLSAISGLWEPSLLVDGITCRLVPPENPGALEGAVRDLLADPMTRSRLGTAARSMVETHFTLDQMANSLAQRLDELSTPSSLPQQ